jgi:hypothetical protein
MPAQQCSVRHRQLPTGYPDGTSRLSGPDKLKLP